MLDKDIEITDNGPPVIPCQIDRLRGDEGGPTVAQLRDAYLADSAARAVAEKEAARLSVIMGYRIQTAMSIFRRHGFTWDEIREALRAWH